MKLFTTTMLFVFLCLFGTSQNKPYDSLKKEIILLNNKINQQNEKIKQTEDQINYQKDQMNSQIGMLDTAFDGVSSQLGASSYFVGIFTVIIAVLTIGLGIYVSRIERNIRVLVQDNETLLLRNVQIREEIQTLSDNITNNSKSLYNIIRNEESNHIIERLLLVPNDIINLNTLLLSRELEPRHFINIKEAVLRADEKYKGNYSILFFQHFAGISMFDDDVKDTVFKDLDWLIENSFKNDIVKSSSEFFNSAYKNGIIHSKDVINLFAKALSKSKYLNYEEIYFGIFNQMINREDKFLLYENIEKTDDAKKFRKEYGKLLLDFKTEAPSLKEQWILREIETLNSTL